jgi:CHAT domain-containing protein
VPDGILWRLPFQALQDGSGRHLIERVALAYAPSLALLRNHGAPEPAQRATGGLLALADPLLPVKTRAAVGTTYRKELVPLPEARVEARTIARYYDDSRVLIGADATEAAAKELAAGFRILHVATHGIIDDAAPMYSALLLTASGADDGLLEAREMIDLHLGADLAILSACESGGGGLAPGEGVIGMSWALMVAGCRNTVVSQWDVASSSTAKLMIAFHRALSSGGDYATALRKAQLELMSSERFHHPFYWSPFVLISTSQ